MLCFQGGTVVQKKKKKLYLRCTKESARNAVLVVTCARSQGPELLKDLVEVLCPVVPVTFPFRHVCVG